MLHNNDVPKLDYGGTVFRFPYHDVCRPLSTNERQALRASIEVHGIQHQIVVRDKFNDVIDGAHRLHIACDLGIPLEKVPILYRTDLDNDRAFALACQLNDARRQQSAADLAAAVEARRQRVQAAHDDGKSTRQIAEAEEVSQATVVRDLEARQVIHRESPGAPEQPAPSAKTVEAKKLIDGGMSQRKAAETVNIPISTLRGELARFAEQLKAPEPQPAPEAPRVNGTDGKTYKAKTKAPDGGQVVDAVGKPVPERLLAVFALRDEFRKHAIQTEAITAFLGKVLDNQALRKLHNLKQSRLESQNLYQALTRYAPHAVCPECNGAGMVKTEPHGTEFICGLCKMSGWLLRGTYENHLRAHPELAS